MRHCAAAETHLHDDAAAAAAADGDASAIVLLTDESALAASDCAAVSSRDAVQDWGQVQAP